MIFIEPGGREKNQFVCAVTTWQQIQYISVSISFLLAIW